MERVPCTFWSLSNNIKVFHKEQVITFASPLPHWVPLDGRREAHGMWHFLPPLSHKGAQEKGRNLHRRSGERRWFAGRLNGQTSSAKLRFPVVRALLRAGSRSLGSQTPLRSLSAFFTPRETTSPRAAAPRCVTWSGRSYRSENSSRPSNHDDRPSKTRCPHWNARR